jgi:hypothetical protein
MYLLTMPTACGMSGVAEIPEAADDAPKMGGIYSIICSSLVHFQLILHWRVAWVASSHACSFKDLADVCALIERDCASFLLDFNPEIVA